MTVRIEHADMLEAIPRLVAEGVVCDAVVTDPPYTTKPLTPATVTMRQCGLSASGSKPALRCLIFSFRLLINFKGTQDDRRLAADCDRPEGRDGSIGIFPKW